MKNTFLIYTFIISGVFISFNNENSEKTKSIKGRWYYIENKNYKEIHACDSLIYIFDWSNSDNRAIFNRYHIKDDTLWSQYYFASQLIEKIGFHNWGYIERITQSNLVLIKDTTMTILFKLDDIDTLFTKRLAVVYLNHKLDTFRYNQWMNYQFEYENRMIEYYKKHPELMSK